MSQDWSSGALGQEAPESEWSAHLRRLIDEGQCFLAYDQASDALRAHPESQLIRLLGALALVRSGAVDEARRMLAPFVGSAEGHEPLVREVARILREKLPLLMDPLREPDSEALLSLSAGLVKLGSVARFGQSEDRETLQLLGELYFDLWRSDGAVEDLRRARDLHLRGLEKFGDRESGVDAALASWLLGESETASAVAQLLVAMPAQESLGGVAERFSRFTSEGELLLMSGAGEWALGLYQRATALEGVRYTAFTAARERLGLLAQHGLPVPPEILELLRLPVIVVFAGQPLDYPGQEEQVFPPQVEQAVGRAIRERLEALNPDIGYSSAACGSDLLFIEAMLERDAEVHVMLPCAIEDFIAARVAYAGTRWERRFRTALRLATSVSYATEERFLGHEVLFRFNNQIIDGMARLRAELLGTAPHLVLVWDYAVESRAGTAADFMDHWADISRLRLIDLDEERSSAAGEGIQEPPVAGAPSQIAVFGPERVVRSMLFADIVGFSKLREEELPGLWDFLADIKARTDAECAAADLVESWGDALYVVMSTARDLLRYAFVLQECFERMDPTRYGLSRALQLRVGLHAGPVYEGMHPLTGKPIVYGSHVSRTARIEPVTVPGQIYASQQFVALLTSEVSVLSYEQQMTGEAYDRWYTCEYLGTQQLAKKYGKQPVYHLRPAVAPARSTKS